MKALKKTMIGVLTAAMTGTMIMGTALAAEATQEPAATAAVQEDVKTFTTEDGVLSIQVPQDEGNWMVIDDPNSWFALSDGKDLIAVDHVAAGDQVPQVELANEHYEEIFQMFYSTQNEVFVVTGRVADKNDAQHVRDAVQSFKVLKYGEVQMKEAAPAPQPVYAVRDINEIRYCTERDGVNVRSGYTTDDPILGGFHYGDQVAVTGVVTKDGADTGWIRVNYNGQTGYTVAQFYSNVMPAPQPAPQPETQPETQPEDELIADGQIFTGFKLQTVNVATEENVTISELSQGGYADENTGEIFTQEGGGGEHFYGDRGTVLMIADAYYRDYQEDDNGEFHYTDDVDTENELINDGQIFTDNYMSLYTEDGYYVLVRELSQGGYINEETGEIFTQEGGGGDHFYGDRGTVLVSEWYYNEYMQ